jgi:hypothetical protein
MPDSMTSSVQSIVEITGELQLEALPRLLYVGDVPIDETLAGSLLLYRLLDGYPADKLRILEYSFSTSKVDRRLPNVNYALVKDGHARVLFSRLASLYRYYFFFLSAQSRGKKLLEVAQGFKPQAVLTVGHGYLWAAAAVLSEQLGIPLHIILHDNWGDTVNLPQRSKESAERMLARAYRKAASKFCVSPFMAEAYSRKFQVAGTVLYPSRGNFQYPENTPEYPPRENRPFCMAYGGSIGSRAYAMMIAKLANLLSEIGAELLLFGAITTEQLRSVGLKSGNVTIQSPTDAGEFIRIVRDRVDALFVPMSFESAHRSNVECGFPGKLADYSATGLPILIWGPHYCSAVRWAKENDGVAEIVEEPGLEVLFSAIRRLACEPQRRLLLGERSMRVGQKFFSRESAMRTFLGGLTNPIH